jgi:predicted porin
VQYDATQKLRLAGGIAYDVYQRDIITGDESAQRYWLGGSYKFSKNIRASLQIEDNINNTYNNDMQGRFILDYNF